MDFCATGLLDWDFNHLQGILDIVSSNKVFYQAQAVVVLIRQTLSPEQDCHHACHIGHVKVFIIAKLIKQVDGSKTIHWERTGPDTVIERLTKQPIEYLFKQLAE